MTRTRVTIGIAVASCDEADLLDRCLQAAGDDFDEVIVYDLASSDGTSEVADRHNAALRVLPRPEFVEMIRADQLREASTDWVLFLDPDELLPAGWATAAKQLIAGATSDTAGYWLAYREVAFGRPLLRTRSGAAKIALVRRQLAEALPPELSRPHVPLRLLGTASGPTRALPLIEHHGYRSVADSVGKISRYAVNGGVGADTGSSSLGPLTAIKMLWGSIVMGRAYQDGLPGIAVASLSAIGDYLGLLVRWDTEGRDDSPPSSRTDRLFGMLRALHRTQWWLRSRLAKLSRGRRRSGAAEHVFRKRSDP